MTKLIIPIRLAAVFCTITGGLCASTGLGQEAIRRKPNVVILFIDDLGFGDIACFGNKRIPTPNIDSMAAQYT